MKIATFNVNGIRSRLSNLLQWLEREQPDVVCLQELKAETFPERELREAGYRGPQASAAPRRPAAREPLPKSKRR